MSSGFVSRGPWSDEYDMRGVEELINLRQDLYIVDSVSGGYFRAVALGDD